MKSRFFGLFCVIGAFTHCATNDDETPPVTPPPSIILEAGSDATEASPSDVAVVVPTCTDAFCRVDLPGLDAVALNGVWARSASDVWIVGSSGFAAHYDGTQWQRVDAVTKQSLFAIWSTDGGPIWGTSTGDAFFSLGEKGDAGVVNGGWFGRVTAISGTGPFDAYVVGDVSDNYGGDNIWRYTSRPDGGGAWFPASPSCNSQGFCRTLRGVWAESAQIQWFAGDNGKIYRTDTTPPDGGPPDASPEDPPPRLALVEVNSSSLRALNGLWGFGGNDIWAVGVEGVTRHLTSGDSFAVVDSPVGESLNAVWGASADDVWSVGDNGTVLHWDGTTWNVVPVPVGNGMQAKPRLYGVGGTKNDVWIVGENTLLRTAGKNP